MRLMMVVAISVALVGSADAASLCKKRTGVLVIRDGACKARETSTDLSAFGAIGPKGDDGQDGQDLTVADTLAVGQTLTGVFSATGNVSGGYALALFAFRPNLPAALDNAHAQYLTVGTTSTQCTGAGSAASGYLCVYEKGGTGATVINTRVRVTVPLTKLLRPGFRGSPCPHFRVKAVLW